MTYVDGFVFPVKKKNLAAYKKMARLGSKMWRGYGALAYFECKGDDMKNKMGVTFPKLAKAKSDEVVFFSFIVYKSKAHRNQVMKKMMNDASLSDEMKNTPMPFDVKRMAYGGFSTMIGWQK